MKTLVCFFNYDGMIVNIQRHIVDALLDMDCETRECHITELEKVAQEFQPIMVLLFHPNKEVYKYKPVIQTLHCHVLAWDLESPYESDIIFDLAEIITNVFTSDENTANALKASFPYKKIFYVPHACNPKVHHPMEVPYEYKSDILFVGNAYPSRIQWFRDHAKEYKDQMVTLVGVGYRGLDGYQNQRVLHTHISEPEMIKYINGAKLVLNLHRMNSDLDMANARKIEPLSFNNRYFEVAACGKQQLVVGRGEPPRLVRALEGDELAKFQEINSYKKRLKDFYLDILR